MDSSVPLSIVLDSNVVIQFSDKDNILLCQCCYRTSYFPLNKKRTLALAAQSPVREESYSLPSVDRGSGFAQGEISPFERVVDYLFFEPA